MTLASLPKPYRAVVFGASGGIGGAIWRSLQNDPQCSVVYAGAREPIASSDTKSIPFVFNLEDEASIAAAAAGIAAAGEVDLVVIATGLLHSHAVLPEKTWRSLSANAMLRLFAVNTVGPALVCKHMLPLLRRGGRSVLAVLSARVSSISDNQLGGWHSYRASKAALNMLVRTFAIELARTHPQSACVCLHPGTVETPLSLPYLSRSSATQPVTPDVAAVRMLTVLENVTPDDSGRLIGWDGIQIPF